MTQDTAPVLEKLPAAPASNEPYAEQTVEVEAPPRTISYRELLSNHNFRLLWAGEAISTFGTFFTRVAVPIYVFSLTNSYAALGFAAFSTLAASLLFGLFAGALADRWDRRRTMMGADIANGIIVLTLLTIVLLPLPLSVELGTIFAVNFCAGLLRELFTPSRVALFVEVLSDDELLAANSLDQATTTFCELLSYPLAAAAILQLGPALAFGVDAATFFVSALLIWGVRTAATPREASEGGNILGEIAEGLRIASRLPLVRELIVLSLIIPLNLSLLNTLQLPYAVDILGSTKEVGYPLLEGAMALGVVLGMLSLGRWGQHISRSLLLAYGVGGAGLAVLCMGLVPYVAAYLGVSAVSGSGAWSPLLLMALPLALLGGATNSLILAGIRTTIQEQTPRTIMGRVFSVVGVASGLGFALGALLTGFGQGRVPQVLLTIGVVLIVIGLFCRWWLPRGERATPHPERAPTTI
jgi:MFS family permease